MIGCTKVGKLNLHSAELRAPSDVRVALKLKWWRLPATTLPIGGLDILEVFSGRRVIKLDIALKNNQGVTGEQVGLYRVNRTS
jgi:hypothetical protein